MKAHLLYEDQDFAFPNELPRILDLGRELPQHHQDLVRDLELVTLFNAMCGGDRFLFEVSMRVILASLDDPKAIVYRQQVLDDCLEHPDLARELYDIATEAIDVPSKAWGWSSRYPAAILGGGVKALEMYMDLLRRVRRIADEHVAEFHSPGFTTLFGTLQRELDDDYFHTIGCHLKKLRFKDGVLMSVVLDKTNAGVGYVLRDPGDRHRNWKKRIGMGPKTSCSFTIPPRDEAGAEAVGQLEARGINLVANAVAQSADHIRSFFSMLRLEIGFYVCCLNLHDHLAGKGEPLCTPTPVAWNPPRLSCSGLGDICLSLRLNQPVVGNDTDADGKSLVMITGANSGGKSTFLRSVGLAQLMMQAGMFVLARSFQGGVARGVFSHFIREEDSTMSSGRLDEELRRMSMLADHMGPRSLVLFNESFAGTNEHEGSELGRQVVRALLESGCKVLFVTHLYDLAESFHQGHPDTTLFLRAERDEGGHRNFKLAVAEPLPTSYGEDLYHQIFDPGPGGPNRHGPAGLSVSHQR